MDVFNLLIMNVVIIIACIVIGLLCSGAIYLGAIYYNRKNFLTNEEPDTSPLRVGERVRLVKMHSKLEMLDNWIKREDKHIRLGDEFIVKEVHSKNPAIKLEGCLFWHPMEKFMRVK